MAAIRELPSQTKRVETGAVQFGDDWPGVFQRGDDACYNASMLASLAEKVARGSDDPETLMLCMMAVAQAKTLVRCDLQGGPTEAVERASAFILTKSASVGERPDEGR